MTVSLRPEVLEKTDSPPSSSSITHVPLLAVQRKLYGVPRGVERFREYLRTMIDSETGDLALPLVSMNPFGKDHLPTFLDEALAFGAEEACARLVNEHAGHLRLGPGVWRTGLVVTDDRLGGWTNRYTSEYSYRFVQQAFYRRGWIVALLWTSESYTAQKVAHEMATCLQRAAWIEQHGAAKNLREMLRQEGAAMKAAGAEVSSLDAPSLDADDLEYTGGVLRPLLERSDRSTVIAALFGDAAARELGYPALGLSPRAGLVWARHSSPGA